MRRSVTFTIVSAAACGVLAGAARIATSSGQAGALVRLQATFPGVVQTGSINVSGLIRGDQLNLSGPNRKIYAFSSSDNSIVGISGSSSSSAFEAYNSATGALAYLSSGGNGLVAIAGSGGYAGAFFGDTLTNGNIRVNGRIGFNAEPTDLAVTINDPNYFALGNGDVTKWIVTSHPNGNGLDVGESGVAYGRLHLSPGGKIGINTDDPQRALDLVGELNVSALNGQPFGIHVDTNGFNGVDTTSTYVDGNGVFARAQVGTSGYGLFGVANEGYGVVGYGPVYGLFAQGSSGASGTKSFRIDHPADPLNKYLLHYSAEGPVPQNIYNGQVTTDEKGYATVTLPAYYESINKDARIQVSVVDESDSDDFVHAKIVQKVRGGQFVIRTSAPGVEVFWEVKAVRNDLFVQKHGAPVEMDKVGPEQGKYQHPDLYGAPPEMGMKFQAPAKPMTAPRNGAKPLPRVK